MSVSTRKIPLLVASAALLSLALAVVTQSQTVTSLVQPSVARISVQDLPLQEDLRGLVREMDARLLADHHDHEAALLRSVLSFQLGETDLALQDLEQLVERAPEFHLAHLVRADLLAARVTAVSDIGSPGFQRVGTDMQLAALRDEIQMRLRAHIDRPNSHKVPVQLLQLSEDMHTALLVDKSRNRLYLYERRAGQQPPTLVRDYYVSTGRKVGNKTIEGDLRTPEGVYFITSWIPDDRLPEKYGIGAFPMDYPNSLDRRQGKTGDGIWLHGTDRIYYSRPPLDSEGCVVMSNIDLQGIRHLIKPGVTPIIIAEQVQWVSEQEWRNTRESVLAAIEGWRQDWQSLDMERYLSHYAADFWSAEHDLHGWSAYKRRVAQGKTRQEIELDNLSLFYSPVPTANAQDMIVVRFRQTYRSNNFNSVASKRLYLAQHDTAQWKIVYEGQ